MRIVQPGSGAQRTLVIVYHVGPAHDAVFTSALPADVALANDTGPSQSYYETVPVLPTTTAALSKQLGASFSRVIVAGFSAGGFATRRILNLGGDPDVLVLADATYGTDLGAWTRYADAAAAGRRMLVASYSSNTFMEPGSPSPWRNLQTITGLQLPLGAAASPRPAGVPVIDAPAMFSRGNIRVFAYPNQDHNAQGREVLPRVLLPTALGGGALVTTSWLRSAAIVGGVVAGIGIGVYLLRHHLRIRG